MRQLRLVHGADRSDRQVMVLDGEPVTIGREPDGAGFALEDAEVSRRHAEIAHDPNGGWTIRDLGSRNGTFVGGQRRETAPLGDGTVIRVGRNLFVALDVIWQASAPLLPDDGHLRGPSLAMQRVRGEIDVVAKSGLPVLIHGETGVGKEIAAERIHAASGRRGAFVPVNCSSIPAEIGESQLFAGAHGGTLFLDEIGEMPLGVQPKLLRALETTELHRADVRVIATTNRDIDIAVAAGTLRPDLLARLAGWRLEIPPLRERRDDILALVLATLTGRREISADAAEALLLHDWPGNVRELEQVVAAAMLRRGREPELGLEHLPAEMARALSDRAPAAAAPDAPPPLELTVSRDRPPSREDLERVLDHYGGNVAQVASFFGKGRQQVYRWLARYRLSPESFRK